MKSNFEFTTKLSRTLIRECNELHLQSDLHLRVHVCVQSHIVNDKACIMPLCFLECLVFIIMLPTEANVDTLLIILYQKQKCE